jgi:hypothetical protein
MKIRRRSLSPIMEVQPKLIRDSSRLNVGGGGTARNSIARKELTKSTTDFTKITKATNKDITP